VPWVITADRRSEEGRGETSYMHGMGGLGFGLQDPCLLFWGEIRKWTNSEQTGEAQRREKQKRGDENLNSATVLL